MTQAAKSSRYLIQAKLTTKADQECFEALVEASGLSKADYIRFCCLETTVVQVPNQNLLLYAQLGTLQMTLRRAVKTELTPDLEQALELVKAMRLQLVGMCEQGEPSLADRHEAPTH